MLTCGTLFVRVMVTERFSLKAKDSVIRVSLHIIWVSLSQATSSIS